MVPNAPGPSVTVQPRVGFFVGREFWQPTSKNYRSMNRPALLVYLISR